MGPLTSMFSQNRGAPGVLPVTVKQIREAFDSAGDKSSLLLDGVDATNVKPLNLLFVYGSF